MGELLDKAIVFATSAHSGQVRKMANTPYILHPLEVATIIATLGGNEELMAAGLLHDTVEDCNVDPLEIRKLFGSRVHALVASETEDKLSDRPPEETWMERKQESLIMLKHSNDIDVKKLWLGDKLSNIRSFYRAYVKEGDAMWHYFHQNDPKMQAWYYRTITDCLSELSDTVAYKEYVMLVEAIFASVSKEETNIELY